jgi:hypothetical protein
MFILGNHIILTPGSGSGTANHSYAPKTNPRLFDVVRTPNYDLRGMHLGANGARPVFLGTLSGRGRYTIPVIGT